METKERVIGKPSAEALATLRRVKAALYERSHPAIAAMHDPEMAPVWKGLREGMAKSMVEEQRLCTLAVGRLEPVLLRKMGEAKAEGRPFGVGPADLVSIWADMLANEDLPKCEYIKHRIGTLLAMDYASQDIPSEEWRSPFTKTFVEEAGLKGILRLYTLANREGQESNAVLFRARFRAVGESLNELRDIKMIVEECGALRSERGDGPSLLYETMCKASNHFGNSLGMVFL
jgi:hypothetical protein